MSALVGEKERTLVMAARTDPGAFAVLYAHHVDRVYAYAWHSLRDRMAADDVVAETFERALQNLCRYEWRGVPFSAWLFRIASHVIAARYRQPATVPLEAAGDLPDRDAGPAALALRAEQRRDLQMAVAALPLLQQQVLRLYYGHDLCYREIAVILERSEGAITQALYRARRRLQHRLAAPAGGEEGQ